MTELVVRIVTPELLARADRSGLDPFKRVQAGWQMTDCWPPRDDGLCGCGCGSALTGRRTRWASDECSLLANRVYGVLAGHTSLIRDAVFQRDKGVCAECGCTTGRLQGPRARHAWRFDVPWLDWEADHILPVHQGGGGCWIDNFRTVCVPCHKVKTAADARRRAEARRNDPTQTSVLS